MSELRGMDFQLEKLLVKHELWKRLPEPPYTLEIKKEKCILVYQHVYDSYHGAGQSVYT